jgi:hypothetical protein
MHAAHEAGAWLGAPPGCFLIALTVTDESALAELASQLRTAGVRLVVFHEPDLSNQATAVAALVEHSDRRRFNSLPLWRIP